MVITMKAAIIYYTLEGHTDFIAEEIAKKTDADKIKLVTQKEFPKKGFKKFLYGGKSVIFKEKPKLKNKKFDLEKYDTIIIGTPIWASMFASPILTFITDNHISNQQIYLFTCSGGGSVDKCFAKLEKMLTGNTVKAAINFVNPTKDNYDKIKDKVTNFCNKIVN